ncbi:MAG: hypothetical protein ACRD2W_00785 [Acidimicrobiales bacterium]
MALEELAGKVRPVVLAGERLLPVLDPLAPLLPDGALRRGSVVTIAGLRGPNAANGSTSLALALLAGASAAGSWCAAVGLSSLGVVAAAELGVALDRFPLVAAPPNGEEWAWATAALLDAVDVVVARPPGRIRDASVRRLAARARERSAVLLVASAGGVPEWQGADVRLAVTAAEWEGVGQGHGRLRARRVEVVATGRAAAARERRVTLWLPGPDGGVACAGGEQLVGPEVTVVAGAG